MIPEPNALKFKGKFLFLSYQLKGFEISFNKNLFANINAIY